MCFPLYAYYITTYLVVYQERNQIFSVLISAAGIGGGNEGGKTPSVSLWLTPPSGREAGEKNGDTYIIRVRVREFLRTC